MTQLTTITGKPGVEKYSIAKELASKYGKGMSKNIISQEYTQLLSDLKARVDQNWSTGC